MIRLTHVVAAALAVVSVLLTSVFYHGTTATAALVSPRFLPHTAGVGASRSRHVAADVKVEWTAVQIVVGDTINPQAFLYPVMNATGSEALNSSAILQISPDLFLTYQSHPAYMMAAVQRMVRQFDKGSYGIYTTESINQQANIFNLNGLTPQQQADLITRVATQPLATSYLAPPTTPSKPAAQGSFRRPINPITNRFRLPSNLGGALASSRRAGSGCEAPCTPLADYVAGPPAVFTYEVAPPLPSKSVVNGIYWVGVFPTIDAARAMNLKTRDLTRFVGYSAGDPSWFVDTAASRLPIAQPVADNEWLRGYETKVSPQDGTRDCYAVAGVRYNNVLMVAQVDNYNSVTPPGYATCQTSYKWSTRVLAALYLRAQRYALKQ